MASPPSWLALAAFVLHASAQTVPAPASIPFNNTRGYGPDGPWHFLSLKVGAPAQSVDFYPSMGSVGSMMQAKSACDGRISCLDPRPGMYDTTVGSAARKDLGLDDRLVDINNYEGYLPGGPNNYTGGGRWWIDQVNSPFQAQNVSFFVTDNVVARSPRGPSYVPLSTFSLEARSQPQPKVNAVGPFDYNQNYLVNYVRNNPGASSSWGLHIGSPTFKLNGSLFYGGYDQSRLIESPAVFDAGSNITLTSLSVDTASGASPFIGGTGSGIPTLPDNLIKGPLNVDFSPATPYINLPASVCDAMQQFLPISYRSDLGIYVWDTGAPSYKDIVTSPTYLEFAFGDAAKTSIRVPFSLLSLTLTAPLVDKPTAYFPCAPSQGSSGGKFVLGRAFLQGAFLGRSFDGNKIVIGQAPGPSRLTTNIAPLPTNGNFVPAVNAPAWEDTWAGVLQPIGVGNGTTGAGSRGAGSSPLSTTSIIGLSVGLAVFCIMVCSVIFCVLYRRKKRAMAFNSITVNATPAGFGDGGNSGAAAATKRVSYASTADVSGLYEMDAEKDAAPRKHSLKPLGAFPPIKVPAKTATRAESHPSPTIIAPVPSRKVLLGKGRVLSLFPRNEVTSPSRSLHPQPSASAGQQHHSIDMEDSRYISGIFSKRWTKFRAIDWGSR